MEIDMVGIFYGNQYGGNGLEKSTWWKWFVCNNILYGNPHGGYVLPVMIVGPTKFPSGYSGTVTFKSFVKYFSRHAEKQETMEANINLNHLGERERRGFNI